MVRFSKTIYMKIAFCLVQELMGRIIRVEFAKDSKKTSPPPTPPGEKRYKLYVSNLAWRVRSNNLKEFFATKFNPLSTRVVFESPEGRSAGYGFVTFASKEEAESAIAALNGKVISQFTNKSFSQFWKIRYICLIVYNPLAIILCHLYNAGVVREACYSSIQRKK